jgi:hypothetical protein
MALTLQDTVIDVPLDGLPDFIVDTPTSTLEQDAVESYGWGWSGHGV